MFYRVLNTPWYTEGTIRKKSVSAIGVAITQRKMCPYSEIFWPVLSRIWTEYGKFRSKSPYSVQMQDFLPTLMESIVSDDERILHSLPIRDGCNSRRMCVSS